MSNLIGWYFLVFYKEQMAGNWYRSLRGATKINLIKHLIYFDEKSPQNEGRVLECYLYKEKHKGHVLFAIYFSICRKIKPIN